MASCTLIEGMLQAYVDGELGQADRVILDEHVSGCATCRAALRTQQRVTAELYEVFSPHRLTRDLVPYVVHHLPEIDRTAQNVEIVNWRAKHPADLLGRLLQWVPIAAVFVLICLGIVLHHYWPKEVLDKATIGVVTQNEGNGSRIPLDAEASEIAEVKSFVRAGDRYVTEPGTMLMLAIAGPTMIKMNEDTRIQVLNDRRISLEQGQVWVKVGKDGRLFRVATPTGTITVFGTTFDVRADTAKTTVTVAEGQVQIENDTESFRVLNSGDQAEIEAGAKPEVPHQVDIAETTQWAKRIEPDREAHDLFTQVILPRTNAAELPGEPSYVIYTVRDDGKPAVIKAIFLEWKGDGKREGLENDGNGYCGYNVYVSDENMRPIFKQHIPEAVFGSGRTMYEVPVPDEPIRDASVLHVRVVPDRSEGEKEILFTGISAMTL